MDEKPLAAIRVVTPEIDNALRAAHRRSTAFIGPIPTIKMPPYFFQEPVYGGGGYASSSGKCGVYRHGEKK